MKKFILLSLLACLPVVGQAESPVVSGYGLEPYHGYIGLGYDHNMVELDGYQSASIPGMMVTFGHNYTPWLDLEFRASTATDYRILAPKTTGVPQIKLKYNYHLLGLLKFKWQPVNAVELSLLTGLDYLNYETSRTTTQDFYKSSLVLGAGAGIRLTKHYSLNLDYLSYQRHDLMDSDRNAWASANLSLQYHF